MSNHRFYLAPARWTEERPTLDAADSHHCVDVLRLSPNDKVVVFDGLGNEAEGILIEINRKHTRLSINNCSATPKAHCAITLAQAVPKARNMDLIIQKAVELGASAIVPILTDRTIVHLEDESDAARKRERWQLIAIEACKQSGQNWMPEIGLPRPIIDFLSAPPPSDLILIASLQPDALPIKETLSQHSAKRGSLPARVVVLVGPEGDFTPAETALAKTAGAVPITLGPIILRSETAAIYCLSVLGHELFHKKSA